LKVCRITDQYLSSNYKHYNEKFEDTKGVIRIVYRRRTDNTMYKRKRTKGQTMTKTKNTTLREKEIVNLDGYLFQQYQSKRTITADLQSFNKSHYTYRWKSSYWVHHHVLVGLVLLSKVKLLIFASQTPDLCLTKCNCW
jgi:Tfp pilus tip-associated adhesin PilY1